MSKTAVKMQGLQIFKKFLMPGGLCAAVPVIKSTPTPPEKPIECSNNQIDDKKLIRPSELPIYVHNVPSKEVSCKNVNQFGASVYIEEGFGTVRKNIKGFITEYRHVTDTVKDKLNTSMEHSSLLLDYLREESNMLPRIGAVGIGGLTGLIFSLRGGKFKKIIYTTTGIVTAASICYPKEAKDTFVASKHYINIGYNFIYGVKPGDEKQLEISWPELPKIKIPTSFSEFINLASDTGSAATDAIGTFVNKATDQLKEEKSKQVESETNKDK